MRSLNFEAERDEETDSWTRADPLNGTLARLTWEQWGVHLPDGDDAHIVTLRHESRGYVGECDCSGYQFHDGPCAHLCAVRKAEFLGIEDAAGEVVHIADEMDAADQHVERAVADGGRRGGERR
jgi:hypothetical protein